ncbi:phosphotransferase family protein [Aspergillus taichungensis]|uniref:Phosphotransferase family protein n=1 Tax=Aspergillus taichungensis TaxID=482145 RepID=A0A2J5I0T8_9EURO|nr:phosphotransferase family protein [Aspergillus taichungensis]
MNSRLPFDDAAWEKSDEIEDSWLDFLFDEDIYNEIGVFLAEHACPRQWADFKFFRSGGFNASFLMTFTDSKTGGAVLRLPLPGVHMFPEEKVRNEASIMQFIMERTSQTMPIPVPMVSRWGERNESPSKLGPFIIMSYIDHARSMSDLLETPGRQPKERPELNPDINTIKLKALYRELANIVFSLSTLSANRIGSLKQTGRTAWEVAYRPLSMSMNEIVRLGTLPRSKLPTATYDRASLYFEALAELHIAHLKHQRNNAIDSADDCRRKFVARFLFRKLVRDRELRDKWMSHEHGPFPVWCDDFRPQNVMVDEADTVVGVVDWEFTYTAPVGFTHAPPWWLLLEKPEYWTKGLDDWCTQYERRLQIFLQAMMDCEEDAYRTRNERLEQSQRLSSRMRHSWASGDFWIMYAARNNFAFDAIYWNKIDRRFFGSNESDNNLCDAWKKRLHLLEPEEKETMDQFVDLKLSENQTRLLSWDPDQYTLDFMAKMEA